MGIHRNKDQKNGCLWCSCFGRRSQDSTIPSWEISSHHSFPTSLETDSPLGQCSSPLLTSSVAWQQRQCFLLCFWINWWSDQLVDVEWCVEWVPDRTHTLWLNLTLDKTSLNWQILLPHLLCLLLHLLLLTLSCLSWLSRMSALPRGWSDTLGVN